MSFQTMLAEFKSSTLMEKWSVLSPTMYLMPPGSLEGLTAVLLPVKLLPISLPQPQLTSLFDVRYIIMAIAQYRV